MKKLIVLFSILSLTTNVVHSSLIYEYTGNVFTDATPLYEGFRITGFVEIDIPLEGLIVTDFLNWSFTAGPTTLSSNTANIETIPLSATLSNDYSTFTLWNFYIFLSDEIFIETTFDDNHLPSHTASIDLVGIFPPVSSTLAKVGPDEPGNWILVPEPCTLLLLGLGGLALRLKRSR